jgi:hypothetical protein
MHRMTGAPLPDLSGHGPAPQDVFTTTETLPFDPTASDRAAAMEVATGSDAPTALAPAPIALDDAPSLNEVHPIEQKQPDLDDAEIAPDAVPEDVQQLQPALEVPDATAGGFDAMAMPLNAFVPDNMMDGYAPPPPSRMRAFARLRFADGSYYMYVLLRSRDLAWVEEKWCH